MNCPNCDDPLEIITRRSLLMQFICAACGYLEKR